MEYNHNGILYINSKDINKNDIIKLGNEEYRIIHIENNLALCITNKIIDHRKLHYDYKSITYEETSTRNYLNHNYLIDKFKRDFLPLIKKVNQDKIFLLSIEEANLYFKDDFDRKAIDRFGHEEYWWLRSQNKDHYKAYYINEKGKISNNPAYMYNLFGLRPAFWLTLDEKIDWNKLNRAIPPTISNIKMPYIGMNEEDIENTQCGQYYSESISHVYTWKSHLDCNFLTVICENRKVISVSQYFFPTHWNEDNSPKYGGIKFID